MMSLPVWLPGPMFLLGVSLSVLMFLPGDLCPGGLCPGGSAWGLSVWEVSIQEGLCLGGSLSRGSPSVEEDLSGRFIQRTPHPIPTCGEKRAVRILLKCFFCNLATFHRNGSSTTQVTLTNYQLAHSIYLAECSSTKLVIRKIGFQEIVFLSSLQFRCVVDADVCQLSGIHVLNLTL